jgi:cysteinyl-tRNA synthetase
VLGLGGLAREQQAPAQLLEKARERDAARAERDFARADAVRDEIEAAGWEVRDTAGGTVLYRRHDV